MSPTTRTCFAGTRRNPIPLLLVVLMAAATMPSTPALAIDSSAAVAAVDHPGTDEVSAARGNVASSSSSSDDDSNDDDDAMDFGDRQFAALFDPRPVDGDAGDGIEKRRSKIAAFRSDLGKRGGLGDDLDDAYGSEKRAYRTRGGKAFKADLGKRARGGASMFRSDLGRRSDPSLASDPRRLQQLLAAGERDFDGLASLPMTTGELLPAADAEGESHEVDRRRSMFRSDLGKRSTRGDSVRRMFRADLGKRGRVAFRHDLG